MRRRIPLVVVFVLALTIGMPAGAITYGQPDGSLHPEVGALVHEWEGELIIWCSGTLVSPTVFLTAAHCVMNAPDDRFLVTFDEAIDVDDVGSSVLFPGTAYWEEGAWAGGMNDAHDLAVIVLDQPVVGITPATLPTLNNLNRSALRGATFTPVGYGTTRDTQQGGGQSIIPVDGVRRYATQGFFSLRKAWLLLSMVPAIGSGGTCYGDSGGPHFLGGVDSHLIVSITVNGDMYCKATDNTYRLDTAGAREFLGRYVTLP